MSALASRKEVKQIRSLIILAVLCLCFVNAVYAQGRCQYKFIDYDIVNEKAILHSTGQPVNGVVCSYYDNGKLRDEDPYKDGKREGVLRIYSENGKLGTEIPYKDGKMEGISRVYYKSGKLKEETPCKNDKIEGIVRQYSESGKLIREFPYKNSKMEGIAQIYTENGRLFARVLYKNDVVVSGVCGNGRAFTNAELINWENGHEVLCRYIDN